MPKISLTLEADDPYFLALMDMGAKQRKAIVRQVVLLCMATDLDPEGGLEVLAKLGVWLNERPAQAAEYGLHFAGLQLFQKLQK
jgi:hypothetical protein